MAESNTKKRTQLTIKQKNDILDALKRKEKIATISLLFNCDRSTISKIKKNEVSIRENLMSNKNSETKCSRSSNFQNVKVALL